MSTVETIEEKPREITIKDFIDGQETSFKQLLQIIAGMLQRLFEIEKRASQVSTN